MANRKRIAGVLASLVVVGRSSSGTFRMAGVGGSRMQQTLIYPFIVCLSVAALHEGKADEHRNRIPSPEPNALVRAEQEYLKWSHAVSKPVVVILTHGKIDSGQSGVLISSNGHILTTAAALPENVEKLPARIQMHDGLIKNATLFKRYPEENLAILKVDEKETPFLTISSQHAKPGSLVLAVGNSLNGYLFSGKPTINAGVICRYYSTPYNPHDRGQPPPMKQLALIEIDAGVNDGNYGGALVDIRGRLIGIVSRYVHKQSWLFGAVDLRPYGNTILTDIGVIQTQDRQRPVLRLPELLSMQTTFQAAANQIADSVVTVETKRDHEPRSNTDIRKLYRQRPESGCSSGVVIRADGYIMTSWFNVKDSEDIHVTLPDNKRYRAELKGHDETRDLAVLKIDQEDLNVPDFARGDDIIVGHFAIAVGRDNPGKGHTISTGIISATHRHYQKTFETDAQLNFGNSGGAIVNSRGQLLGVAVYQNGVERHGHNSGVGFGIRMDSLNKVLPDLINGTVIKKTPVPFLGIAFGESIEGKEGVHIGSVTKNSGAEKAEMKAGDIITLFNSYVIADRNDLLSNLREHAVGDTVVIQLERGDQTITVSVTLTESPKP